MKRLSLVVLVVAGATALVFMPRTQAFALTSSAAQSAHKQPAMYTTTQEKVKQSPIAAHGLHVPLQVALQLYKKALTRSWSVNPVDLDKLVCIWRRKIGSHFEYLYCQTNREHQHLVSASQLAFTDTGTRDASLAGPRDVSKIRVVLAGATAGDHLKRGALAPLFEKLPPANASYTVRVTNHGKPAFDYVIKNGNLIHVYEYVYKNDNAAKGKH